MIRRRTISSQQIILFFLIFLLLPDFGQAQSEDIQSHVDKARYMTNDLLDLQEKLVAAQKHLDTFSSNDSRKATDENGVGLAKQKVAELQDDLREASRRYFHVPPEKGLIQARRLKRLLEWHDTSKEGQRAAPQKEIEKELRHLEGLEFEKNFNALDEKLRSFGMGVALGAVIDVGGRDRIESASLDPNGIVRVEQDSNTRANFMLEAHFFLKPNFGFPFGCRSADNPEEGIGCVKAGDWGFGPFVAVQPGSQNIIEAVGAGVLLGFKKSAVPVLRDIPIVHSFNLGVGAMLDVRQRVLGDGIRVNEKLPVGETAIRFRETSQIGAVVIFSAAF